VAKSRTPFKAEGNAGVNTRHFIMLIKRMLIQLHIAKLR